MWRRKAVVVAAAALLWAMPAQAKWTVATGRHFTVYSEDTPTQVRAYAEKLERFDLALSLLFGRPESEPSDSERVTIYVFGNATAISHLLGQTNVAGFYEARADGPVAFATRQGNDGMFDLSAQAVLLHEFGHHYMYTTWPDAPFPLWFTEGFAEFVATAKFETNGNVTLGGIPMYRLSGLREGVLPVSRLLTTNRYSQDNFQNQTLYGRAWLLVHYLLIGAKDRHGQLDTYLRAMAAGKPALEAATQAFGDLAALERDLNRYETERLYSYGVPTAGKPIGDVTVRDLTSGEAAVMPAQLRSDRGVDAKTAPEVAALAEKLAAPFPGDAGAQNELAEAEYDARNFAAADAAAARALLVDPKSVHALCYRGLAQEGAALRDHVTDPATWQTIRHWFIAANKVQTEDAWPLELFYQSFAAAHQPESANAVAGLLYAQKLAPFDGGLRINAGLALLRQGRAAEARTVLAPVAYSPHEGQSAKVAQRLIDAIDTGGATKALAISQTPANTKPDTP